MAIQADQTSSFRDLKHLLPVRRAIAICGAASGLLLIGAFLFEYVGGMAPCKLCIWQRWAHAAIIAISVAGLLIPGPRLARFALMAVILAATISGAIAGYHAGVEWQLWQGPSGCTAALTSDLSATMLVDQLLATPVIRCDEVPWSLFGISMAGWNSLFSLDIAAMALISVIAGSRSRPA